MPFLKKNPLQLPNRNPAAMKGKKSDMKKPTTIGAMMRGC